MTTITDLATVDLRSVVAAASKPSEVVEALGVHAEPAVVTTQAAWPEQVTLDDAAMKALAALPSVFNTVAPAEPKILDDEEITALYSEREVLRQVVEPIAKRDEVIKEIIRHHMDLAAEAENRAVPKQIVRGGHVVAEPTPRDDKGHYILASKGNPERVSIPGTNQAWSREYREGRLGFPEADERLLDMYEAGEITREQYLALTREKRVFDEGKAMEAMRKDPSTFVAIVSRLGRRSSAGTSLFVRKAK
jgi:hypothetical protein